MNFCTRRYTTGYEGKYREESRTQRLGRPQDDKQPSTRKQNSSFDRHQGPSTLIDTIAIATDRHSGLGSVSGSIRRCFKTIRSHAIGIKYANEKETSKITCLLLKPT